MHDQKLIADYLRKCFVSVDGLWFMKVEEDTDFEKALDRDIAVWRVLPKIEARTIQGLIDPGEGLEGLRRALEFKLSAELFRFELSMLSHGAFDLELCDCPWVCHIKKANRQQFLERISESICQEEYRTFAGVFGRDITVEHNRSRCRADGCCRFMFRQSGSVEKV